MSEPNLEKKNLNNGIRIGAAQMRDEVISKISSLEFIGEKRIPAVIELINEVYSEVVYPTK